MENKSESFEDLSVGQNIKIVRPYLRDIKSNFKKSQE